LKFAYFQIICTLSSGQINQTTPTLEANMKEIVLEIVASGVAA